MGTGVVVNGYEIQNWHTVSILELARARREQEREAVPVVVESKKSKKNEQKEQEHVERTID